MTTPNLWDGVVIADNLTDALKALAIELMPSTATAALCLAAFEIQKLSAEVERYRADLMRIARGDNDGEMGYLAYQSLLFGLVE